MTKPVEEIVAETTQVPTLDPYLDRHPSTLKFPEDYMHMVDVLRQQRAQFIQLEQEKKDKKI